jgi:hypothetical protein
MQIRPLQNDYIPYLLVRNFITLYLLKYSMACFAILFCYLRETHILSFKWIHTHKNTSNSILSDRNVSRMLAGSIFLGFSKKTNMHNYMKNNTL